MNIEALQSVKCAIRSTDKNLRVSDLEVFYNADQLAEIQSADKVYYYGILTVGKLTDVELELYGGSVIEVSSNSQIIEVFQGIDFVTGLNAQFRGWQITARAQ